MNSEEKTVEYRISTFEGGAMVGVAILADLIGLIPIIGLVGSVLGWGTILLWQTFRGVPVVDFRARRAVIKIANIFGNAVGEVASGAVFPSVLIYTLLMVIMTRAEDKTGLTIPVRKSGGEKITKRKVQKTVQRTREALQNPERALRAQQRLQNINTIRKQRELEQTPR